MTLKTAERQLKAKRVKKENTELGTCISCDRKFWATEAYMVMVKAGRTASLCRDCSKDESDDPCFVDDSAQL